MAKSIKKIGSDRTTRSQAAAKSNGLTTTRATNSRIAHSSNGNSNRVAVQVGRPRNGNNRAHGTASAAQVPQPALNGVPAPQPMAVVPGAAPAAPAALAPQAVVPVANPPPIRQQYEDEREMELELLRFEFHCDWDHRVRVLKEDDKRVAESQKQIGMLSGTLQYLKDVRSRAKDKLLEDLLNEDKKKRAMEAEREVLQLEDTIFSLMVINEQTKNSIQAMKTRMMEDRSKIERQHEIHQEVMQW